MQRPATSPAGGVGVPTWALPPSASGARTSRSVRISRTAAAVVAASRCPQGPQDRPGDCVGFERPPRQLAFEHRRSQFVRRTC